MAANPFVLTAQLKVVGPVGLNPILRRIRSQVQAAMSTGGVGAGGATRSGGGSSGGGGVASAPTIAAASNATQKLAKSSTSAAKAQKALATGLIQSSRQMSTMVRDVATLTGGMITLHGALIAVVGGLKALASYEQQMGAMAQITRTNTSITADLGKEMRGLAKEYGVSTDILGKNAIELLQAGRSMEQVKKALPTLALLGTNAQVGADGLAVASKAMIVWQNTFKQTQEQTAQSFEKVIALAKRQFIGVSELIEGTTILAATAKSSGASFEEMISIIASTKSQAGRPVTEVSRALNTLMSRIVSPRNVAKLKDSFQIDVFDDKKKFRGILTVAEDIKKVRDSFGEASKEAIELDILLGGLRRRSLAGSFLESLEQARINLEAISGEVKEMEKDWERVAQTIGIKTKKTVESLRDAFIEVTSTPGFKDLMDDVLMLVKGFTQLLILLKDIAPSLAYIGGIRLGSMFLGAKMGGLLLAGGASAGGVGAGRVASARNMVGTSPFAAMRGTIPAPPGVPSTPRRGFVGATTSRRDPYTGLTSRQTQIVPGGGVRPHAGVAPMYGPVTKSRRGAGATPRSIKNLRLGRGGALGLGIGAAAIGGAIPTQGEGSDTTTRGLSAAFTGASTGLLAFSFGLNPVVSGLLAASVALNLFVDSVQKAKTERVNQIARTGSKNIDKILTTVGVTRPHRLAGEIGKMTRDFDTELKANRKQKSPNFVGALAPFVPGGGFVQGLLPGAGGTGDDFGRPDIEAIAGGITDVYTSIKSFGTKSPFDAAEERLASERQGIIDARQASVPGVLNTASKILEDNPSVRNLEDFQNLEGGVGKRTIEFLQKTGDVEALERMIAASAKVTAAFQALAQIAQVLAKARFEDAVIGRSNIDAIEQEENALRQRAAKRSGAAADQFTGQERLGTARFQRAIAQVPFGQGGRDRLQGAQNDVKTIAQIIGKAGGDLDRNALDSINTDLEASGISPAVIGVIKKKVFDIGPGLDAPEGSAARFDADAKLAELFADLFKFAEDAVREVNPETFKAFDRGISLLNDKIQAITADISHAGELYQTSVQATTNAQNAQLTVLEKQSQFTSGRPLGGGLGNQIALGQAQSLAGTSNTAALGTQLRTLESQREAVRINSTMDKEQQAERLASFDIAINQSVQALNILADSSQRLRGVQEELARAQEGLAAKYGVAEEFIGAGQEGRAQMIRDAAAADIVTQRGSFQGISDEGSQAALRHLNRFGNIEGAGGLSAAAGFTGEEIKKALIESTVGAGFFGPEKGAERQAQDNIIRILQDSANAQWELARYQDQVFSRFANQLTNVFNRLGIPAGGPGAAAPPIAGGQAVPNPAPGQPGNVPLMPFPQQPGAGPGQAAQPGFQQLPRGVNPGAAAAIGQGGNLPINRQGEHFVPLPEQRARNIAGAFADKAGRRLDHQRQRALRSARGSGRSQDSINRQFNADHANQIQSHNFNRMRQQGFTPQQAFERAVENRIQGRQSYRQDRGQDPTNVTALNQEFARIRSSLGEFGAALGPILDQIQERFVGQAANQPGIGPQAQNGAPQPIFPGAQNQPLVQAQPPDPNQQATVDAMTRFNESFAQGAQRMSDSADRVGVASEVFSEAADRMASALGEKLQIVQQVDVNVTGVEGLAETLTPVMEEIAKRTTSEMLAKVGSTTGMPIT